MADPTIDTHLDVSLRHNARSTLQWCGLLRMRRPEKQIIESVRIQEGNNTNQNRRMRWSGRHIRDNEMIAVLEQLSSDLPSLRLLRIRFRGNRLPCEGVLVCLRDMKNLVTIRILDVEFQASNPQDLQYVATALQQSKIQKVTLDLCRASPSFPNSSLQPLMDAVAKSTTVEYLALNNTQILSPQDNGNSAILATQSWMEHLCSNNNNNQTLKTLKLEMMEEIKNQHMVWLAQSLEGNRALEELCIETCNMEQSGCEALAKLLCPSASSSPSTSTCGLKRLSLQLFNKRSETISDDNDHGETEIDWDKTGLAMALTHNKTLQFLRIFAENITQHGYPDAFLQMIRTNVTLQHLVLGWEGETSSDIEFFLRLNRSGRNMLTSTDVPKRLWVDFINRHSTDLSALVDVFSRNPLLIQEARVGLL